MARGDCVIDPEAADAGVGVGQREAIVGEVMGEKRGIEIQAVIIGFGPVDPGREVLGPQLIARDFGGAIEIRAVQRQAVIARNQAVCLVEVAPQFIDIARFARIVAGGHDAAAEPALRVLEAADIVPLPAMQADGHGL